MIMMSYLNTLLIKFVSRRNETFNEHEELNYAYHACFASDAFFFLLFLLYRSCCIYFVSTLFGIRKISIIFLF